MRIVPPLGAFPGHGMPTSKLATGVIVTATIRLLRLFGAFRTLEQDRDETVATLRETVQEQSTQNLLLQDRLDSVMNDRAELWRMMESAINNERATLQMQVNFATQQKFGVTPFPEATHLPSSAEPSAENAGPFGRRMMPSEMIANRRTQFIKEFQKRHQPASPVSA